MAQCRRDRRGARGAAALEPQDAAAARWRRSGSAVRPSRRQDESGLTQARDWQPFAREAATLRPIARRLLLRPVRLGAGWRRARHLPPAITSRKSTARGPRSRAMSPDLPHADRSCPLHQARWDDGRGRIDETGTCVLYFTRAEIEDGALAGKRAGTRLGGRSDRPVLPRNPGLGPAPLPDGR